MPGAGCHPRLPTSPDPAAATPWLKSTCPLSPVRFTGISKTASTISSRWGANRGSKTRGTERRFTLHTSVLKTAGTWLVWTRNPALTARLAMLPGTLDKRLSRLLREIAGGQLRLHRHRLLPALAGFFGVALALQGVSQVQESFREIGALRESLTVKLHGILELPRPL